MQESEEYPSIIPVKNETEINACQSTFENLSDNSPDSEKTSEEFSSVQPSSCQILYQDELQKIKGFEKPTEESLKDKLIYIGPRPKHKKFTLVLDLDNTLVYTEMMKSNTEIIGGADVSRENTGLSVKIRPYAINFLLEASEFFEIVVFTAANEAYANQVVNLLDPEREIIKTIISRKNCWETKEGFIVKDLRVLTHRKMSDLIIVDDSIYSFAFQIGNGIPIKPYLGEEEDEELMLLSQYLIEICEDNPQNLAEKNKQALWAELDLVN